MFQEEKLPTVYMKSVTTEAQDRTKKLETCSQLKNTKKIQWRNHQKVLLVLTERAAEQ